MVRFRHTCKTKWLVKVNKHLTDAQRSRIQRTPFHSLMEMPEKLRINCILLSKLASRWVENRFGFKIQDNVVPFSPVDVVFSLGLRIVGLNVNYNGDEDAECHTKGLFKGEEITVKTIVKQLRRHKSDDKVDDFCRLYILLGFVTFYFPQSSTSCLLRMLDNLNSLQEYSWGAAVYDTLVLSLNHCAKCLNKSKNKSVVRITGCAAILQIWALEHMFLRGTTICTTRTIRSFPRFLRWRNVAMRKDKILKAFEDNCILEKLAATSEELQNDVVMEAMQKAPSGFPHWHKLNLIAERETRKHQVILAHKEIKERISFIQDDLMMIKQVLQPTMQPSPQTINYTCEDEANTWCDDNRSSPKDHDECHIEEQNHQVRSNIYTRLKDQPRKRIESAVTRSPWTTYQRRRNKGKEVKAGNL